jgi:hypothetical protein
MRTVIVGSVLAVICAAVGCRGATAPGPAVPPPVAGPAAPESSAVANASTEHGHSDAPTPPAKRSVREEGEALFVKPLGFLQGLKIAVGRDGVVVAASGGCNDERGPLVGGARDPGSFVVLAKLDNEGTKIWAKTFFAPCGARPMDGTAQTIAGVGLDRDGNIYLAGDVKSQSGPIDFGGGSLTSAGGSDIFVASFDASGQHRWSKRFGAGEDQHVSALAVSPEGLVAIAGSLEGGADFGGGVVTSAGKSDALVVVLDSKGQHIASHAFGDADDQHGDLVAFGTQGELTLGGRYEGAINFGGGRLPSGSKAGSAFLAQYQDNGPGSSPRYGFAFSKALPGEVTLGALTGGWEATYVAGEFKGVADFGGGPLKAHEPDDKNAARTDAFVVKLDATGKPVFSRAFGLGGTHRIGALALAGDLWIAGEFSGMTRFGEAMVSAGDEDALLVHLDADKGEVKRAWRFGDAFAQDVLGLAVGGSPPSVFVLARTGGTIDFGTGPQSEHGDFLVKMAIGMRPVTSEGPAPDSPRTASDGGTP